MRGHKRNWTIQPGRAADVYKGIQTTVTTTRNEKAQGVIDRYHVFTFLSFAFTDVQFQFRQRAVIKITRFEEQTECVGRIPEAS